MKTIFHPAESRGHADHGWLNTWHSFSFAGYYNPDRMHFGALRVLNDDTVAPGRGFGRHPHDNMEIISIPLKGDLKHEDSMGNSGIIHEGDVQIMSAGTGIEHSEYNKNSDKPVSFLQIWVIPRRKNVEPRYDQISLQELKQENTFYTFLSPDKDTDGVWIHQDAWFSIGSFDKTVETNYELHKESNGLYVFALEGEAVIADKELNRRDAIGIWETESVDIKAKPVARLLLLEVPMVIS